MSNKKDADPTPSNPVDGPVVGHGTGVNTDAGITGENIDTDWGAITHLLRDLQAGREGAFADLVPMVYAELRFRAHQYLRQQRKDHTLEPTALVHEAYLRIAGYADVSQGAKESGGWKNRAHFFAVAATAMRQILVDHARYKSREKRGGGQQRIPLVDDLISTGDSEVGLLDLDEALQKLAENDDRLSRVVELRFFAGLTVEECAEVLAVGPATVKRDWVFAKTWLLRELKAE